MDAQLWLSEVAAQYQEYKTMCEKAAEQVTDEQFFETVGDCPQSIAIIMKHVGGNNHSRWRNFLTTDGEKRDRNRETEFDVSNDTRDSIRAIWDKGWLILFDELSALTPADLGKTVTIRGEPHSVVKSVMRNLAHNVYHSGQIVLLARQLAGQSWQFMSIPPGQSDQYNPEKASKHGSWWNRA